MRGGRLTRLLIRFTVLDCVVAFIVRPTLMLVHGDSPHSWQLSVVHTAGACATLLLPVQFAALWLLLRPVWSAQSVRRQTERRVSAILKSEDLQIAFQPVLSVCTGRVVAVEALSRFPQSPQRGPDEWFAEASVVSLGVELELLALQRALEEAAKLGSHLDVAINLSPCALTNPRARELLLHSAVSPMRLIVEITEHCVVIDYDLLNQASAELRAHGVRLAVDDAGSGYASFQHVVRLAPDLIKLDRSIITGLDADPARRALVKHIVGFAAECGAQTVAEGVETRAEMACVTALQVDHVQGYFTGKPTTDPEEWATWTPSVAAAKVGRHTRLQAVRPAV